MMMVKQQIDRQDIELLNGWQDGLYTAPNWVRALRETAAESLINTGLPTPAWEDWQYTNLRALEKMVFAKPKNLQTISEFNSEFLSLDSIVIQLFNDKLINDITDLPDGLTIDKLDNIWSKDWVRDNLAVLGNFATTPMEALNTAFLQGGIVIHVQKDVHIEKPILLISTHKNDKDTIVTMPRILIVLEEGAKLDIIEHHQGDGSYLNNQVTTITLNKNTKLGHYIWQNDDKDNGYSFNTTRLNCFDNSIYDAATLTMGAKLSRHEIFTDLLGSNISCILNGAYHLGGDMHHDTTIKTGHFEPRSTSKQIYKGVINDKARAVFQGKIYVHRHAQRTDGHQLNHALLLSEKAEINAKPELEIYADDVKCAHGATSGDLDEAALFYLRSRGIPELEAKELLIKGFLVEAFENITNTKIRDIFLNIVKGDKL